jgi:PadR family transcriptional regulator, regulatory protein PadR
MLKKADALGQFEQLCLTAVLLLRDQAYGIAVHEKIQELAARPVLLPAAYVTLDRLEEKGYLKSRFTEPTPQRGGRRKRCFRLLPAGERALAESAATAKRIYDSWRSAGRRVKKHSAG